MRKALIIGAGGLLGSAIHSQLQSEGAAVTIAQGIQWKDSAKAQKQLCDLLESFLLGSPSPSSQQNLRVEIFWCAGAGVIGTSVADLEKEVTLFEQVIDTLTSTLQDAISGTSFFYASSAGGVYAGSKNPPFTENSEPKPLSPYGESKLACERKLELLNAYNVKVVIGRFTNIYGPGQNISKPQGLISQICLAHHRGLHSKIYVSLDTLRDYVFVRDAAFMSVRLMDYVSTLDQASTTIKIIGSGTATTIAELMGIANKYSSSSL